MSDLVEFLRARLDEDAEEIAQHPDGDCIEDWEIVSNTECDPFLQIAKKRALAEVESKRRIIAQHTAATKRAKEPSSAREYEAARVEQFALEEVFRALAVPYAGHPDYRQEWKP